MIATSILSFGGRVAASAQPRDVPPTQSEFVAMAQAISSHTFQQPSPQVVSSSSTTVGQLPAIERSIVTDYGQATAPTHHVEVIQLAGAFTVPTPGGTAGPTAGNLMLILDGQTGAELYVRAGGASAAPAGSAAKATPAAGRSAVSAPTTRQTLRRVRHERSFTTGPLTSHAYSEAQLNNEPLGMGGETTVVDTNFSVAPVWQYDFINEEMWVGTNNTENDANHQWGETGLTYRCCSYVNQQFGNWGMYFFWASYGDDCQDSPGGLIYVCYQEDIYLFGPYYPSSGTHYTLRVWYSSSSHGYVYQINNWTEYIDTQKSATHWVGAGLESTEDTGITVPRSYFNPLYWQNVNNGGFHDFPVALSVPFVNDPAFCGQFDTSGSNRISWDVGLAGGC